MGERITVSTASPAALARVSLMPVVAAVRSNTLMTLLPWLPEYRNLIRYFAERYWLQAVADYDLVSRVKFVVIACLLIRHLGGNFQETAQLFSKEIENDADNVDAILDAAYTHPAFTDEKLLGMILK